MKSKNILHVIASMNPKGGGVCQAVLTIVTGLSAIGIHSEVVSLDDPNQHFLYDYSFPVHCIGQGKGPWCYHSELIPWLVNNLSRFEVIIIHGLWLFPGYAVQVALKKHIKQNKLSVDPDEQSLKILVMPHGMLDPYFQRETGRRLKAYRNWIYWKLIEGRIINSADKILFTSEEECKLAGDTFSPYNPKEELVVGLGVDEPPLYSHALKEAFIKKCPDIGNSSYILFLSRIHEKKGLDILLDAYVNVTSKLNRTNSQKGNVHLPKLIIAGPGQNTPYGEMIQKIVFTSPVLSRNIIFTDMLRDEAKWGAFYGCEAFVLPSYQENFGIAVVEAMACQKPVLISNKVNIWREIKSSGSGIISDPSVAGIEQLLESWYELNAEKRSEMGKNARLQYQNFFAVKSTTHQFANALL